MSIHTATEWGSRLSVANTKRNKDGIATQLSSTVCQSLTNLKSHKHGPDRVRSKMLTHINHAKRMNPGIRKKRGETISSAWKQGRNTSVGHGAECTACVNRLSSVVGGLRQQSNHIRRRNRVATGSFAESARTVGRNSSGRALTPLAKPPTADGMIRRVSDKRDE